MPASLVPIQLQLRREMRLHQETQERLDKEIESHQDTRRLLSEEIVAHKRTQGLLMDESASHAGTKEHLEQILGSISWCATEPLRRVLHAATQGSDVVKRLMRKG